MILPKKIDFAIIAPESLLRVFSSQGDCHMAIAPIALDHSFYANYYKQEVSNGKLVILDNGAFELDKPLSTGLLEKALFKTRAQEVVAPDMIGDSSKSLKLLEEFINQLSSRYLTKVRIQAIIQGHTLEELESHYLRLLNNPYVNTIGITHAFQLVDCFGKTDNRMFSRVMLIDYFRRQHALGNYPQIYKPLHLMGMTNPIELFYQYINNIREPFVRSNDSSAPVQYGRHGYSLDELIPVRTIV